jgi:glycosyltransferase involved in cell wall biosynthesis
MLRIDRKELKAPARVIDLDLSSADGYEEDKISVEAYRSVWCLSRVDGVPHAISFWDVTADTSVSLPDLRESLRAETDVDCVAGSGLPAVPASGCEITVVICTRDRPETLRVTLNSLQRQTDADFRVLVVDNASTSPDTAAVVEELSLPNCEFAVEPHLGLSRARNRGLQLVTTDFIAYIDDDETADLNWIRRLKEGFAHESKPAAVCGIIVPAELEYEAQVRVEQYGGLNKGRDLTSEVLRAGTPSVTSPLYPLPAFGAGGNMAFRTELLRAIGGFDNCLGAGTRTHGCEETRAFSALLSAGHAILHWPAALIWHPHRRDMTALRKQFYGYSAGVSAFYMSTILSKPSAIFEILRLAPHALRDMRGGGSENLRSGHLPDDFPGDLLRETRRGYLKGGPMYIYEVLRNRRRVAAA